jgi:hypothetical protein
MEGSIEFGDLLFQFLHQLVIDFPQVVIYRITEDELHLAGHCIFRSDDALQYRCQKGNVLDRPVRMASPCRVLYSQS